MIGLARKLGIRPGQRICLLSAPPEAEAAVRGSTLDPVEFIYELGDEPYDMILFWPDRLGGLAELFASLQGRIRPHGAIWAVMPKKKYAPRRGIDFTWEQMQAAGLQTDLVDNKVASITEQDYGTRFVIRKERRPA